MKLDALDLPVLEPRPMPGFVETPQIKQLIKRSLIYIEAGFPVHFRGGAGTGKTTLALHIANLVGRPVVLIHGDEDFSSSDLVGASEGYRKKKVVDRFISSVLKVEEDVVKKWVDSRLTIACEYGFTLIYDEFTRSRPEANNVLLSVLQEKLLGFSKGQKDNSPYLKIHPDFTAIFTSNPEEYAGVHKVQDALRDRMITLDLDNFDKETEIAITQAKSDLAREDAVKIVNMVRALREKGLYESSPSVRVCIMIAKSLKVNGGIDYRNKFSRDIVTEILCSQTSRTGDMKNKNQLRTAVKELVRIHFNGKGEN
ncbi:MAG: gas vesicle protein GvpN [Chloroflexi bacterium]|nr:gas vesicle protein GvpN [Chloroflexota bacterium]